MGSLTWGSRPRLQTCTPSGWRPERPLSGTRDFGRQGTTSAQDGAIGAALGTLLQITQGRTEGHQLLRGAVVGGSAPSSAPTATPGVTATTVRSTTIGTATTGACSTYRNGGYDRDRRYDSRDRDRSPATTVVTVAPTATPTGTAATTTRPLREDSRYRTAQDHSGDRRHAGPLCASPRSCPVSPAGSSLDCAPFCWSPPFRDRR